MKRNFPIFTETHEMKYLITFSLLFFILGLGSCDLRPRRFYNENEEDQGYRDPEKYSDQIVSRRVTKDAEFPGGQKAMAEWLRENLVYPEKELDEGVGGRVFVRFVVARDGRVSHVTIIKGVTPGLNKAAKTAVENMPDWKPATENDRPVNQFYNLPIRFNPG